MQLFVSFVFGLVCLSAVFAGPLTDEEKAHLNELKEKCIKESGVNPELLEHGKGDEAALKDEKLQCFGACMLKSMKIFNEAGDVDLEVATAIIPPGDSHDKMVEVVKQCAKDKGANPCETAGMIFKCLHENKAAELLHMGHE